MKDIQLTIQTTKKIYLPIVMDDITWTTSRKDAPGELKFKIVNDHRLAFSEGAAVTFRVDNVGLFKGFVFSKSRGKEEIIEVVAFDSLRYLKNKHSIIYTNKKASDLIKELARDFALPIGKIQDTGYKIPTRTEMNKMLLDIIYEALNLTLINTGEMFVLFDDYGKLALKNIKTMEHKNIVVIDEGLATDYKYKSTIDNSFNKIVIHNKTDKGIKTYVSKDINTIKKWGILQQTETIENKKATPKEYANMLLKLNNQVRRSLQVKGAKGRTNIRAGSLIPVMLKLGDIDIANNMLVEKCTHTFKEGKHLMDLTLRGGDINV